MDGDQDPPSLHDLIHDTALARRILPPDLSINLSATYLDHLVSLPLASLHKEPTLISAEAASVESELTNLCYREYSTFLSVHNCSSAVTSAFDDFQSSLDQLLDSVPLLEAECRTFVKKSHGLTTIRNRSILLQDHRDKLLELLELPRLMETCVRNGYYQEAMELAAHGKDLESRYSDIRLCSDVAKEIDGVEQLMFAQLLSLLREPVKLPTVMKTIGYLRRLDMMDEASLGLTFLSGRLYNFRNQLLQIEKDRADPVRYLRKYIDLFREHVYDILSQFSAVFDDFGLLISFAEQCINDMIQLVSTYVPRVAQDTASLSSILIQLGYCSLSFARIGLDFAPLISDTFANTIASTYAQAANTASQNLTAGLMEATNAQTAPIETLVNLDQRSALLSSSPSFDFSSGTPWELNAFPLLAQFVNEHYTAFNTLRLLVPTSLYARLRSVLEDTLAESTRSILQFVREATVLPDAPNGRPVRHTRTPSSPRSHLLRKNTETQLAPSVRAVKRREAQQICVSFAEAWMASAKHLWLSMTRGIFDRPAETDNSLQFVLDNLQSWVVSNRPAVEHDGLSAAGSGPVNTVESSAANGHESPVGIAASAIDSSDDPFLDTKSMTARNIDEPREVSPVIHDGSLGTIGQTSALPATTPTADEGEEEIHAAQPEALSSKTKDDENIDNKTVTADVSISPEASDNAQVVEPMFAATTDKALTMPDAVIEDPAVALIVPRDVADDESHGNQQIETLGSHADVANIAQLQDVGDIPLVEPLDAAKEEAERQDSPGESTPNQIRDQETRVAPEQPSETEGETSADTIPLEQPIQSTTESPSDPRADTVVAALVTPDEEGEDTIPSAAEASVPAQVEVAGPGQSKKKKKKKKK